jgi:3-phenylpropionate/cinnamic acid dioxygenase small subunit
VTNPYEAIRHLLYRYCELMDAGDFEGVAAMFMDGKLTDEQGTVIAEGREGALDLWSRGTRLHDGSPRTRHITANSIIEVDEVAGVATARSSYVVLQGTDKLPLQPIITGRYQDRFARIANDAWRFAERRFFVDQVGDLSHHLKYSL